MRNQEVNVLEKNKLFCTIICKRLVCCCMLGDEPVLLIFIIWICHDCFILEIWWLELLVAWFLFYLFVYFFFWYEWDFFCYNLNWFWKSLSLLYFLFFNLKTKLTINRSSFRQVPVKSIFLPMDDLEISLPNKALSDGLSLIVQIL